MPDNHIRDASGCKVFVDGTVLRLVDKSKPSGMSRTAWVNYLLQEALARRAGLYD